MPQDEDVLYKELTYKVIGAAMKVHSTLRSGLREELYPTQGRCLNMAIKLSTLRSGLREELYQNALEVSFTELGIRFNREYPVEVYYEGQPVGLYFLDFFVEEVLVVELKAVNRRMDNRELAQCLRYMQLTGVPVSLLINFGTPHLEYKRIRPPQYWKPYNPDGDSWLRDKGYR